MDATPQVVLVGSPFGSPPKRRSAIEAETHRLQQRRLARTILAANQHNWPLVAPLVLQRLHINDMLARKEAKVDHPKFGKVHVSRL